MLLKILAILLMSIPTACATVFDTNSDREITITSRNTQTKFYHNGRFIGVGKTATTYASGSGTDVLSGIQRGVGYFTKEHQKRNISSFFTLNLYSDSK